jgi:hypothetical protein
VTCGACRVGTFTYSAAGRKLHVRILNGNLLVRTGGGYQDLLDALGKLPAVSSFTQGPQATSAATAAATAAASILAAAGSISSPRTPTLNAGAFGNHSSSEQECQRSGCVDISGLGVLPACGPHPGAHSRLDLGAIHNSSGSFYSSAMPGPLASARSRDQTCEAVSSPRCHPSNGSAAAFEAAVQAAVAAAVEAAANAGLDDGMGTSGGGAAPEVMARQYSRAALLGRVIAAKTAAGTLIEAGMCPPVPVQEEVGTPAVSAAALD